MFNRSGITQLEKDFPILYCINPFMNSISILCKLYLICPLTRRNQTTQINMIPNHRLMLLCNQCNKFSNIPYKSISVHTYIILRERITRKGVGDGKSHIFLVNSKLCASFRTLSCIYWEKVTILSIKVKNFNLYLPTTPKLNVNVILAMP